MTVTAPTTGYVERLKEQPQPRNETENGYTNGYAWPDLALIPPGPNPGTPLMSGVPVGGGDGNRTHDPLLAKQVL